MENEAKIERIKTLMENFGVTQSEFAKRISIDASNFSNYLSATHLSTESSQTWAYRKNGYVRVKDICFVPQTTMHTLIYAH
mgnify:CR=1 FL=1